jgi:hypothetical protein
MTSFEKFRERFTKCEHAVLEKVRDQDKVNCWCSSPKTSTEECSDRPDRKCKHYKKRK